MRYDSTSTAEITVALTKTGQPFLIRTLAMLGFGYDDITLQYLFPFPNDSR